MKGRHKVLLAAFAVFASLSLAVADSAEKLEPVDETQTFLEGLEKFIQDSKNPTPWMSWGLDFRMREIYAFNLLRLADDDDGVRDDDWHFQRWRLRWWATFTPFGTKDISINTRLMWEFRTYEHPIGRQHSQLSGYTPSSHKYDDSDAMFDILNVTWKNVMGLPLTAVIGRQEIVFGDGWLICEGTPLDGSRTIYFDAIRLTYDWQETKTKIDLIYIDQAGDTSDHIKPFNDQDNHIVEQDERGVILYLTNNWFDRTQIEAYYIYKHNEEIEYINSAGTSALVPGTESANIHTIGARLVHKLNDNITLDGQFAQQMGHKRPYGDGEYHDLCAFGFKGKLIYYLRDDWNNNFRIEYEYLSGDDPGTDKIEEFDPLWGRWPQFSDLYIYTYAVETRIAEVTNLHRLGFGWNCNPLGYKNLDLSLYYHLLWADEKYSTAITAGDGDFRGQLVTLCLKYKYGPHISGHLKGELFGPGDYYLDANNDVAMFLRYELVFTW